MSLFKKIFLFFILASLTLSPLSLFSVFAEGTVLSLTSSSGSVRRGENISINLNISGLPEAGAERFGSVSLLYDPARFEYVSCTGTIKFSTSSLAGVLSVLAESPENAKVPPNTGVLAVITFKAKETAKIGTASFGVKETAGFRLSDGTELPVGKGSPLTFSIIDKLSGDASLSELQIKGYQMNKAFDPAVIKDYLITVPNSVTSVEVICKAAEEAAAVNISGNTNLSGGENTIKIVVTAPDKKSQKIYTVTVIRQAEISEASSVSGHFSSAVTTPADNQNNSYDEATSLQRKYDKLEEKLYVVITLFSVVLTALLCYIVYLLIQLHK